MNKIYHYWKSLLIITTLSLFISCEDTTLPPPTKESMQGVWEVTEAYDSQDSSIMSHINHIIPTYIQLDDKNSVNTTAGPMFMYLVYGKSNFIKVTSKLDEAFKYADLSLTEGEFFLTNDIGEDKFTIEMKMKFPTVETINTILDLMNIPKPNFIENVIYHKFLDVNVKFLDETYSKMEWDFNDNTQTRYNIKNQYGEYVTWNGVSFPFTKARFILTKRSQTLTELVKVATQP